MSDTAEPIARAFHETYERLAPDHGYKTREASAKPWEEVPESNRNLMVAVVGELLETGVIENYDPQAADTISRQEVTTYLDECIRFWRGVRDGTVEPAGPLTVEEGKVKAPQYIDAMQSVRVSLLGTQLPS